MGVFYKGVPTTTGRNILFYGLFIAVLSIVLSGFLYRISLWNLVASIR